MQDEKRKRLLAIHSRYTLEYQKAINETQGKRGKKKVHFDVVPLLRVGAIGQHRHPRRIYYKGTTHFDKLEKWQRLYDITESIPEWPFDASVLKRFWVSWFTVIIAPLLSIFGESMLSGVVRVFTR